MTEQIEGTRPISMEDYVKDVAEIAREEGEAVLVPISQHIDHDAPQILGYTLIDKPLGYISAAEKILETNGYHDVTTEPKKQEKHHGENGLIKTGDDYLRIKLVKRSNGQSE